MGEEEAELSCVLRRLWETRRNAHSYFQNPPASNVIKGGEIATLFIYGYFWIICLLTVITLQLWAT